MSATVVVSDGELMRGFEDSLKRVVADDEKDVDGTCLQRPQSDQHSLSGKPEVPFMAQEVLDGLGKRKSFRFSWQRERAVDVLDAGLNDAVVLILFYLSQSGVVVSGERDVIKKRLVGGALLWGREKQSAGLMTPSM